MDEPKLLNCPFCGSRAGVYIVKTRNKVVQYKVCCLADDSNYHGIEGVIDDWCPMELETPECDTEADAIELWNTRVATKGGE